MIKRKTTLLLILDGWGIAPMAYPSQSNAILTANAPFWQNLLEIYPHTLVKSSGNAVGLPHGVMGNSEVGHLNLGAGRIIWQEITRIDKAIDNDGLFSIKGIHDAIEKARESGSKLHLMGLVSDGGVHSMDRHYFAILRLAQRLRMPKERIIFHAFLDGRDTPPRSGLCYVQQLEDVLQREELGRVGTVQGRYWAMDRDKRWDRVKRAYDAMVFGKADFAAGSGVEAVQKGYAREENDEFIQPTIVDAPEGQVDGRIQSGDQLIFFNFRPDRTRQLSHAFVDEVFDSFERDNALKVDLTTMTRYESGLNAKVAFPPQDISMTLGEVVSKAGMKQLRIAETEKYAHVTYFFSGGQEKEFEGEDRILIPSPRVATYDLQPEMSVHEVAARIEQEIDAGNYDLIISNFANGDMVGHTGNMDAALRAVEAVDAAVSRVVHAILRNGGAAVIKADHGNAEEMWNFDEKCPSTQHSTNPTPLVVVAEPTPACALRRDGCLGDVAAIVLDLMGVPQPPEMTGKNLMIH